MHARDVVLTPLLPNPRRNFCEHDGKDKPCEKPVLSKRTLDIHCKYCSSALLCVQAPGQSVTTRLFLAPRV